MKSFDIAHVDVRAAHKTERSAELDLREKMISSFVLFFSSHWRSFMSGVHFYASSCDIPRAFSASGEQKKKEKEETTALHNGVVCR